MRLISQSGKVDISYDHCVLFIRENTSMIVASMIHDIADFNMGKYNNEQEAMDVLANVRERANHDARYFQFPKKED